MYRFALFVLAAALAPACSGPRPLTAIEIDRRAEALTLRGAWDDARVLVERGLADARARGDRTAEARLLLRRGHTLTDRARHRGGDRAPALVDLEAARRGAEASGDAALVADAIDALGMHRFTHWFSSQDAADLAASDEMFRAALALREPRGDAPTLSESHFHIGLVHQMRGEYAPARTHFERALALATAAHDDLRMSYAARHLGYLAELRRDWPAAEASYRQSLELRERFGAGPGVPAAQVTLAELRYARDGDAAPALALLTRARTGAAAVHSAAYVGIASGAIARVHRDHARYPEALAALTAAIAAMDEIASDEDVPANYEQMALVHLLAGDAPAALTAAELGIARRATPRLQSVLALARARAGRAAPPSSVPFDETDPVIAARLALATGDASAALDASLRGDDPDTLLLAARSLGPTGFDRASPAAAALSHAQALRFERERRAATR